MHEVMRQRILRRLETLPEARLYQVLDYIEYLESKYAERAQVEPSALQRFAEGVEDRLRKKALNPNTLREAFQLISAADKVLADVSSAGKQILDELGGLGEPPAPRRTGSGGAAGRVQGGGRSSGGSAESGSGSGPRGGGGGSAAGRPEVKRDQPPEVALGEEWTVHDPDPEQE